MSRLSRKHSGHFPPHGERGVRLLWAHALITHAYAVVASSLRIGFVETFTESGFGLGGFMRSICEPEPGFANHQNLLGRWFKLKNLADWQLCS